MVRLVPMTHMDYREYLARAVPNFAREQVLAGNWQEENAYGKSEKVFRSLLPEGLSTPEHQLYTIIDKESRERTGFLWYALQKGDTGLFAMLYDLLIFEPYRRQGRATAALRALEEKVRNAGLDTIVLHVFSHNQAAIRLYEHAGYSSREVIMFKRI